MKKTITIFTLIFALLLTTGCAASNGGQEPMEARIIDIQPAATPTEEVVNEQTEAPTEAPTEKIASDEPTAIGKEKALQIALKHAGFSAGDVTGLQVEYDKDDGVPIYEVEFDKGHKEYSYEIHGETGKILSWEIDD